MAIIGFQTFQGEVPKAPPNLLPEPAAQFAALCDFTRGDLRPLKGGLPQFTAGFTVRSLYTEDGIKFYAWDSEAYPLKSPVINESFNRFYWIDKSVSPSRLVVSQVVQDASNYNPPSNSNKWWAGVPTPTQAPALTLVQRTALPDYPGAYFVFRAWWEYNGKRYDQVTLSTAQITQWQQYVFNEIAKTAEVENAEGEVTSGTPNDAVMITEVTLNDSAGKAIFTLSGAPTDNYPSRTSALPGGVEMYVRKSGTQYTVELVWGPTDTRAYVYTVVNTFNEESAPSSASLISPTYIQQVQIETFVPTFGTPPSGYRPYQTTRIYRTFGSSANYVQINQEYVSGVTWRDATTGNNITGTGLTTLEWEVPPTGLTAIVQMPNGWMAGFSANVLYMSEPYRPSTWPYKMTFPQSIRGICVGIQGLVVTTSEGCYVVNGVNPGSVTQMRLPVPQSGISQRSMTNVNGAVAFLSPDGIVLVQGSQATLDLSNKLFTREVWRTRYASQLSNMSLAYHDGFLVAASSNVFLGFMVRTDEGQGSTFTEYSVQTSCFYYVPALDTLYFAVGTNVFSFGTSSEYSLTWQSKDFIFPKPESFGACFIRTSGSVTVSVLLDNTTYYTFTATSTGYYRIPAVSGGRDGRGRRWSVVLSGISTVSEFYLAQTMAELKSV